MCSWSSLQAEELLLHISAFPAYTSLSVTLEGGGSAGVESRDEQSACSLGGKPAQGPELYHAHTAAVGKPQNEIPKPAYVFLLQVKAPWRFLWKKM